jgi:hypothetical protein
MWNMFIKFFAVSKSPVLIRIYLLCEISQYFGGAQTYHLLNENTSVKWGSIFMASRLSSMKLPNSFMATSLWNRAVYVWQLTYVNEIGQFLYGDQMYFSEWTKYFIADKFTSMKWEPVLLWWLNWPIWNEVIVFASQINSVKWAVLLWSLNFLCEMGWLWEWGVITVASEISHLFYGSQIYLLWNESLHSCWSNIPLWNDNYFMAARLSFVKFIKLCMAVKVWLCEVIWYFRSGHTCNIEVRRSSVIARLLWN